MLGKYQNIDVMRVMLKKINGIFHLVNERKNILKLVTVERFYYDAVSIYI